jgi:hypothetical protein
LTIALTLGNFCQEVLLENWRNIHVFVFDTTVADFDAWEAIDVVTKHRRDFVRSRPAIVILNSENSMTEKQR